MGFHTHGKREIAKEEREKLIQGKEPGDQSGGKRGEGPPKYWNSLRSSAVREGRKSGGKVHERDLIRT